MQQKREFSGEFEGYPSMGHFMKECLGQQGFVQYEVSNYARGYYSKHNLGYWEQKEYLGVGAVGVGWINGVRSFGGGVNWGDLEGKSGGRGSVK